MAIDGFVNIGGPNLNAAKMRPDISPQPLIMIARNINYFRAFSRFTENFLNHVIVALRPIPFALQAPAIDNIADQVKLLAVIIF